MMLERQPTLAPTRKVTAAGIGVPVAFLLTVAANAFGVPVTPEITASVGALISALAAYITKERALGSRD